LQKQTLLNEATIRHIAVEQLKDQAEPFLKCILATETRYRPSDEDWAAHAATHPRSFFHLAQYPDLLAALIDASLTSGDLPAYNAKFCRAFVRAIWQKAHLKEALELPALDQVEVHLGRLAYMAIEQDQPENMPYKWVLRTLMSSKPGLDEQHASQLITAGIGAHLLVQDDDGIRFLHPLFQDYFAALELQGRGDIEEKIPYPGFKYEIYRPAVRLAKPVSSRWRMVIVMVCGLFADPAPLLQEVYARNPFLTAECIASGVETSAAFRAEVVKTLLDLLEHKQAVGVAKVNYRRDIKGVLWVILTAPFIIVANWVETFLHTMNDAVSAMFGGGGYSAMVEIAHEHIPADINYAQDDRELRYSPVGEAAAIALGEIGDESAIEGLVNAISHHNRWVRRAAASALASIGERGQDMLTAIFHRSSTKVKEAVVRGLGWTGDIALIPLLLDAISNPQRDVYDAALESLKGYGKAAIPALIEAIQQPDENIRMAAGLALRQLREETLPALIPLLDHHDPSVYFHAVRLIEHIGTTEAYKMIVPWWMDKLADQGIYLKQTNKRVYDAAAEALMRIGTPQALTALERWKQERQPVR
jgi:HEAT repeat protein